MSSFIDKTGLTTLWNTIKSTFVAKEDGKGLSTNDYTDDEVSKLETVSTYTEDSGYLTLSHDETYCSSSSLQYRKIGKLVEVRGSFTNISEDSTIASIATLPEGYIPSIQLSFSMSDSNGNNYTLLVDTDGTIHAVSNSTFSAETEYMIIFHFLID